MLFVCLVAQAQSRITSAPKLDALHFTGTAHKGRLNSLAGKSHVPSPMPHRIAASDGCCHWLRPP